MAVINGFLAQSLIYAGIENPNITADSRMFSGTGWPPYSVDAGASPHGALITSWPVESSGTQILTGFIAGAYSDDYYHRVHVIPSQLVLGNVISTQSSTVSLWNAFLNPITLLDIDGVEEGVELSGQPNPPITFAALQLLSWDVAITTDGPATLDADLTWTFNNGSVAVLNITANRIAAFPFLPDWSDGIIERLTWATDVLQSRSGAQQRRALRISPRREFEASFFMEGRDRQAFDIAMFGWNTHVWAIPIWPDVYWLNTQINAGTVTITVPTTNRDFRAGGLAMLRGETAFQYETVEILSLTATQITLKRPTVNTWGVGARLYPVRPATLAAPQTNRVTDTMQRMSSIVFNVAEASDWSAVLPATTYRGYAVLDAVPDESEDLTSQFQNLTLMLDNGSALPRITDTAQKAMPLQQYRWFLNGSTERAAFRSLLYALAGRLTALWIPTHADDLTLVAVVSNVATTMDIAAVGYTRYGQARVGRRDIRVHLHSGNIFYRRITGSTEISAEVERLQIDTAFGVQINVGDVMRISWMMLATSNSDSYEIKHETDVDGVATSQQIFKGVRDDDIS